MRSDAIAGSEGKTDTGEVAARDAATTSPQEFFEQFRQSFERAVVRVGGVTEEAHLIADRIVRLRFAGPALTSHILPALAHHPSPPSNGEPEGRTLTVCLWDSASTGLVPPPPPWGPGDYIDRGAVRGYNTERIRTAYILGAGVLSMLDLETDTAVYWLRDARRHPVYMTGSPLLLILNWWMEHRGRQMTHAGAVGLPSGGVLLVGRGGSGKSTTTLACLNSSLYYLADDYCLLDRRPPYMAYSLYNSGKLNANSQKLLPEVGRLAQDSSLDFMGKSLFFVHDHMSSRLVPRFPLKAILLPRVTGGRATQVTPAGADLVRQALAPSTIHQLTGAGADAVRVLNAVATEIPGYVLELGTEMATIPAAILELLDRDPVSRS